MRIPLFALLTFATLVGMRTSGAILRNQARAEESPINFARCFSIAEEKWAIRGIPEPSEERLYSSHVGIEIIRAIRRANAALENWRTRFRNDPSRERIPHLEENLFSGFTEPPDRDVVGRSFPQRGRRVVEIRRDHKERGQVHQWTDRLILDRAGGAWVVYDIEYGHGGSLLEKIRGFTKSLSE